MAHTKAKGTSKLGRDSQAKRLGVKVFGGQKINAGMIIIRQRGTKFVAGSQVKKGVDDTLYAQSSGIVDFRKGKTRRFTGKIIDKTVVSVK